MNVLRVVIVASLIGLVIACDPSSSLTLSEPANVRTTSHVPDVKLSFIRAGKAMPQHSLLALSRTTAARVVETDDPYYGTRKRFVALPIEAVLTQGFGVPLDQLRSSAFVLRALDGYAVPITGERLLEGGAYLAFDDVDVPGFAPIGPQRVSPAPTYMVWTKPGQQVVDTHPRPWQLSTIEMASVDVLYPHAAPIGAAADSVAQRGFRLFVDHCIKCHAINREGGRVGPELNVPQSIVEYRPVDQIRAYIKDPRTFRYGAMPAHPQLSEDDLDQLLGYLSVMAQHKHDPDAVDTAR